MPPRRGEVWLFDLGMTAKVRPVLVVSVEYGFQPRHRHGCSAHHPSPRESSLSSLHRSSVLIRAETVTMIQPSNMENVTTKKTMDAPGACASESLVAEPKLICFVRSYLHGI